MGDFNHPSAVKLLNTDIIFITSAILSRLHVSCKSPFDSVADGRPGIKGSGEREINWI